MLKLGIGILAVCVFVIAFIAGFANPFYGWLLTMVICLIVAGVCGLNSVTTKGCGLAERYNIGKDREETSWMSALMGSIYLLICLNVSLFHWAESLVGDNLALIGIAVMAMLVAVGFIMKQLAVACFNAGKMYTQRKLKAELAPKFGACYDARNNPEKAAELCGACERAQEGLCPLGLDVVAQDAPHLKGVMALIELVPLGAKYRPARREEKRPMVTVELDDILKGLQGAKEIFATQAAAGEPQICAMSVEGTWIAADKIDPQEREAFQQGQEKDLHLTHVG